MYWNVCHLELFVKGRIQTNEQIKYFYIWPSLILRTINCKFTYLLIIGISQFDKSKIEGWALFAHLCCIPIIKSTYIFIICYSSLHLHPSCHPSSPIQTYWNSLLFKNIHNCFFFNFKKSRTLIDTQIVLWEMSFPPFLWFFKECEDQLYLSGNAKQGENTRFLNSVTWPAKCFFRFQWTNKKLKIITWLWTTLLCQSGLSYLLGNKLEYKSSILLFYTTILGYK